MTYLILMFMTFSLLACPDFSGHYRDEDNEIFELKQSDCTKLEWVQPGSQKLIIIDGKEHEIEREDEVVIYAAALFENQFLKLQMRIDWGSQDSGDLPKNFIVDYYLDRKGNLIEKQNFGQSYQLNTYLRVSNQ